MNVLSFPCDYCCRPLNAPIIELQECKHNFHEKCFNKVLESDDPMCDRCYTTISTESKPNNDLEYLVVRINDLVKLAIPPSPEGVLYKAVQFGDLKVIKYLMENEVRTNDRSLLNVAMQHGHNDVAIYLLENGVKMDDATLIIACEEEAIPFLEKIVETGKNPNWVSDDGDSSLHIAAVCEDPALLKFLLQSDCTEMLDSLNHWACSPLLEAVKEGNAEHVELLCKAGASLSTILSDGTILDMARNQVDDIVRSSVSVDYRRMDQRRDIVQFLEEQMGAHKRQKVELDVEQEVEQEVEKEEGIEGMTCTIM